MTLWAIVPVKPLRWGKSRLSGVLSQEERTGLNSQMLIHTINTLKSLREIEHVLVVSRDPSALAIARTLGARTLQENGTPELNSALARATVVAQNHSTRGVLILPADLPLLTQEDILAMLDLAGKPPVVVVAPDRHRQGTNALLINPAGLIQYDFGVGSFERHCQRAVEIGAHLEIYEVSSLSLDMDLPEDLQLVSDELDGWSE